MFVGSIENKFIKIEGDKDTVKGFSLFSPENNTFQHITFDQEVASESTIAASLGNIYLTSDSNIAYYQKTKVDDKTLLTNNEATVLINLTTGETSEIPGSTLVL